MSRVNYKFTFVIGVSLEPVLRSRGHILYQTLESRVNHKFAFAIGVAFKPVLRSKDA